jgi:phospholipid-translocating ATPase
VHGHWYYIRVSMLTMYFFYKNLAYCTPQMFFAVSSAFSSQTLFESAFLMMYNIAFTAFPILVFGLFEQNISKETLMKKPDLYRSISKNACMTPYRFFGWLGLGYYHSLVNFFGSKYLMAKGSLNEEAWASFSNWDLGFLTFSVCVIVVNFKLFIITKFWPMQTKIVYGGTLLFFLLFCLSYCSFQFSFITDHHYMFNVFFQVFSLPCVWLSLVVQVTLALLPDVTFAAYFNLTVGMKDQEKPLNRFFEFLTNLCNRFRRYRYEVCATKEPELNGPEA